MPVAGATVSFVGAGTCVINANQAGNANYNAGAAGAAAFGGQAGPDDHLHLDGADPALCLGATYTVTATATRV